MGQAVDVSSWAPRLAKSILRESMQLKRGESVAFEAWTRALPWLDAFLIEARRVGAQPVVLYNSDAAFWSSLEEGKARNLGSMGRVELAALKETDAYVFFWGPSDRTRWHKLPDSTLTALTAYEEEWFRIAKERKVRFCRIELTRATEELAKEYGLDVNEWQKELLEASVVSKRLMSSEGEKIARKLFRGKKISITHPNGTHIQLKLKGRRPFIDDGIVDEDDLKAGFMETNAPCGVVSVAADEEFAEGTIIANQKSRYGPARGATEGGSWTFSDGRLEKYTFESGLENFEKLYLEAGSERNKPGIFSIGLNPKIRNSPLFEDQARGTVSLFVGSNDWLGGANKGDFHSWLLLRGSDVTVDDRPVLRSGKIV